MRCFVGDSNGRTVSIFVMCCGAASLLDHQNCCCGDFSETRSGFPSMSSKADCQFKVSGASMFMLILNSGVRNAYTISYLCIYFFFFSY